MKSKRLIAILLALSMILALSACDNAGQPANETGQPSHSNIQSVNPDEAKTDTANASTQNYEIVLPDGSVVEHWNGNDPWVEINRNTPFFSDTDKTRTDAFETYSDLDDLGRCGTAYANICLEIMPTEERGEIGSVRPSGWHTIRYNDLIPGNYLYNRCHLIGFQLAGENANELNLITGTRYLNIDGMLDFENEIDDYVEETGNHVLYRVTPIFHQDNLVCDGVLMEAHSVEDNGSGVSFCVFAYNSQPGIVIDYATGDSWRADGKNQSEVEEGISGEKHDYILNTNSGKFHLPDYENAASISEKNRLEITQTLQAMLDAGYSPCGNCHPENQG